MKQLDVDVSPPAKYHELKADLELSDLVSLVHHGAHCALVVHIAP